MDYVLQQLRDQRQIRNVTLDQLSGLTGLPVSFLEDLEHDRVDPPLSSLIKITSALNVTVSVGDVRI